MKPEIKVGDTYLLNDEYYRLVLTVDNKTALVLCEIRRGILDSQYLSLKNMLSCLANGRYKKVR
jgi:hypothetical protein